MEGPQEAHLKHLQSASLSAVMVIAADKLHNARSLVLDLQHEGRRYLNNFNTSGANILWYYREMYSALIAAAAPARLTSALGECVIALEDLINTNGYQPLQTIQADWIRCQETGIFAEEFDTVLFTQWRNADEAEPGSVPLKSWTVEAVDAMKRSGAPMVAEVWTKGLHWQVTMTAPKKVAHRELA